MRKNSPTFKKWQGFKFEASDFKMLLIPPFCAHGLVTLENNVEFVNYYSRPFSSKHEKGIRFDDPTFEIKWPIKVVNISDKDKSWENFKG